MTRLPLPTYGVRLPGIWFLLLLLPPLAGYAGVGAPREEPFDSFRRLDSELSTLQNQFTEVRRGVQMGAPAESKQWLDAVHATEKTTSSIATVVRKLVVRYRRVHRRFGVKVFTRLQLRTSSVRLALTRLENSGRMEKTKAADDVSGAILGLIRQYQAVSAGYEKTHCKRKLPCCVPRKLDPDSSPGCKWECVQNPATCKRGFLGSRLEP